MKLLISAYACEPFKGSEPGIGWNWVIALSKYADVTVITRSNNRLLIDRYDSKPSKLNFLYYDLSFFKRIKNYLPFGSKLYSMLWEYFCISSVENIHYDFSLRITFNTLITTVPFYNLKQPYYCINIGGGEASPQSIYSHYSVKQKFEENLRTIFNKQFSINPYIKKTLTHSNKCLVTTEETKNLIVNCFPSLTVDVFPAIGFDGDLIPASNNSHFKLIYAGRFLYWKNIDIILYTLKKLVSFEKNISLSLIGSGPDEARLKKIVSELKLEHFITFTRFIPQVEYLTHLKEHSLFLFPSSHDSGGMVMLESIKNGIPVIYLNTGGAKEIFKNTNDVYGVDPNQSKDRIINDLVGKIVKAKEENYRMSNEFQLVREKISKKYTWNEKAKYLINEINKELYENPSDTQ